MDGENCPTEEVRPEDPRPLMNTRVGGAEPALQVCGPAGARIRPVENGFIVEVGCKTFVSQDWKEIAAGLGEYWKDPTKAEKKFSKKR